MEIVEVSAKSQFLDQFYELYQKIFVDENERESKENIIKYLSLKNSAFYGGNSYHIFCSIEGMTITGFLVGDYYVEPNSGVIEFIGVSPDFRNKYIARDLIDHFIATIRTECKKGLNGIFCEVDTKKLSVTGPPDLTSFMFWKKLGYGVVEIDYVQPALGPEKKSVSDLVLLYKDLAGNGLGASLLLSFVKSYMRYAMSIEAPESMKEYQTIESHINHREFITILTIDEYIKTGISHFINPALDYIVTFPLVSLRGLVGDVEELTSTRAVELANQIIGGITSIQYFSVISVEIQKGDGTPIQLFGKEDFVLIMRDKRESFVSGEYLKSKISIKGLLKTKEQIPLRVKLPSGVARGNKVQIWIDVDHLGIASLHFIVYYNGHYSTREMVALMDPVNVTILDQNYSESFANFVGKISDVLQDEVMTNLGEVRRLQPEIYPLSFSTTNRQFEKIKAHIYGIVNQDPSYDYASNRYIQKFFDEDRSAVNTVFGHYGRRTGSIIFSEEGTGIFEAVTGYKVTEIKSNNQAEFNENVRITILNEYISEVTALLHERLYLKRLEFILSKGDVTMTRNEKKTLRYLADIEKLFYTGLEEFKGLSLYSYVELDFALKEARSDMGIKEELESTIAGIGSLSKKAELLYRIRNDSNIVLLSYLLTLFAASALTVSLINIILPPTASLLDKIIFIFVLPIASIIVLYAFTMMRRK